MTLGIPTRRIHFFFDLEPQRSLEMNRALDGGLKRLVDSLAEEQRLHVELQKDGLEEFGRGEDLPCRGGHDEGDVLWMVDGPVWAVLALFVDGAEK